LKRLSDIFECSISSSMLSLFKQPSAFRREIIMSTICNYRGMRNSKRKSEFISHSDLRYNYFLRKYSICRAFISEKSSRRMSKVITRKNTSRFQKFKPPWSYLLGALRVSDPEMSCFCELGQNCYLLFLMIFQTRCFLIVSFYGL